jgi:hypothetical protein
MDKTPEELAQPIPIRAEVIPVRSAPLARPAVPSPSESLAVVGEVVRAVPTVAAAVPSLARLGASMVWRATRWGVSTTAAAVSAGGGRAMHGDPAGIVVATVVSEVRSHAQELVNPSDPLTEQASRQPDSELGLQMRGEMLIRRSNDVGENADRHPAFSRILGEITPDEARILRFLYVDGPQPSVDVRTGRPLGIGSELIESGLNMIGEMAGVSQVDRTTLYLTNLSRLGLVEFSKEQVSNPQRYQLIEAQPKSVDALKRAGRMPRTVRRSILLNAFGKEFCEVCLPLANAPSSEWLRNPSPNEVVDAERQAKSKRKAK